MKSASAELKDTIQELQSLGIPLSEDQQRLARNAYLKMTGTALLWTAAGATAVKVALGKDLSMVEKLLIGAVMASTVASAVSSTNDLVAAYRAYSEFRESLEREVLVSAELAPAFARL